MKTDHFGNNTCVNYFRMTAYLIFTVLRGEVMFASLHELLKLELVFYGNYCYLDELRTN